MLSDWVGFGIKGYRSFGGDDIMYVRPMEKVHLVVGRNNVGKSNLLHAMHDLLPQLREGGTARTETLFPRRQDRPISWPPEREASISLGLKLNERLRSALRLDSDAKPLKLLFEQIAYTRGDIGVIWFDFVLKEKGFYQVLNPDVEQFFESARQAGVDNPDVLLANVTSKMGSHSSSSPEYNLMSLWEIVRPWEFIPPTAWVDAVRELTANSGTQQDHDLRTGRGLIPRLAKLQGPDIATYDNDTAKFSALQRFVQDVLSDPEAKIEIPRAEDTIHVTTAGGRAMALHSLGTGIGEIIHLAAVATVHSDTLICIEEPEIHLHPALQRKLISYLHKETQNRYLISTHSAALLNAEVASISHVTIDGSNSSIQNVGSSRGALAHAVSDLGNRPSDLVQSNFLVWVEGPSDRIYVNHWLSMRHPGFIEGADYSIMFYGGALLNHLSFDDNATDEFIALLRINRNVAVLIDSDRKEASENLNDTKERVLEELKLIGAIGWVTDGYTVENYADALWIQKAVDQEYKNKEYRVPISRHVSPLSRTFEGKLTKPSKITVARIMAGLATNEDAWHQDLWPHIDELAAAINTAND